MLLPKMLRSQTLIRRSLDQAPARFCAGITASFKATRWQYTPTLVFPLLRSYSGHKNSRGLRHSSYLFPSLSWRQTWCNGRQKSNLLTKVLRDGNQQGDGLLFKWFSILLSTNSPLFFPCQIQQQTIFIFEKLARSLLWPCLIRTTGRMKSLG